MNLKKKILEVKERIEQSDGAFTSRGKIVSRAEFYHAFLPAALLGVVGGVKLFLPVMAAIETFKGAGGHINDIVTEINYFIAGFATVEILEIVIASGVF